MSEYHEDFFEGKRPWSVIKDDVLRQYIPPYLRKVGKLGKPILLIDAYAGPGSFENGEPGSPFIICNAAEEHAKGNYQAFFFNKEEVYYSKLKKLIETNSWSGSAYPQLGDSKKLLQLMIPKIQEKTVFLYLDPFGLGWEFSLLEPFLKRNPNFSTEIMLTMCMPVVHRLAGNKDQLEDGRLRSYRERLTKVFGGDYWKEILWNQNLSAEEKLNQTIEVYLNKLRQYLPFAGACPVRERSDRRIKYFIIFVSRHPHAMLLLNNIMFEAYNKRMHEADYSQTLFGELPWRETIAIGETANRKLDKVILETVAQHRGSTRETIWSIIVQNYFMRYHESDYKKAAKHLVDTHQLTSPTYRKTKNLNDDCCLYLP